MEQGVFNITYIILSNDNAFGQTNLSTINVPFGAFNAATYDPYQFAEGGLYLTDIFGESLPLVDCSKGNCTEEEHQLNRRSDFLIQQ